MRPETLTRRDFLLHTLPRIAVAGTALFLGQRQSVLAQEPVIDIDMLSSLFQSMVPPEDQPVKEIDFSYLVCPIHYCHEVREEAFTDYLAGLLQEGYFFVTMSDLVDYFYYYQQNWPPDKLPVALTIDDGFLSAYEVGLPVLKELNVRATFFVMPDYQGDGDPNHHYMTNEQIIEIAGSGMEIGSHTFHHDCRLSKLKEENIGAWLAEIIQSKERLREITGQEVNSFSYPCGRQNIDGETVTLVQEYYRIAVSTGGDSVLKLSDIYTLPRTSI